MEVDPPPPAAMAAAMEVDPPPPAALDTPKQQPPKSGPTTLQHGRIVVVTEAE